MGGMVLETNMNEIVAQMDAQSRLEKSEVSLGPSAWSAGQMPRAGGDCGTFGGGVRSPSFFLESIRAG